jgi:hypothetical protein
MKLGESELDILEFAFSSFRLILVGGRTCILRRPSLSVIMTSIRTEWNLVSPSDWTPRTNSFLKQYP